MQHFAIAGTGLFLPPRRWSAEEIDQRAGLPAGWTRTHAGVLNRHACDIPRETLADMASAAVAAALDDAGVGWGEIDLLLDASTSRHQPIPCNAVGVLARFGEPAQGVPAFDVQSTCLGFLVAVHVANGLLASGAYRHVVVVCSEAGFAAVNWNEPESACLVGDGAAAVVLRRAEPTPTYFYAHETFPQYAEACRIRGGSHNLSPMEYRPEIDHEYRFHMDGPTLFRAAGKHLPPMTRRLVASAGVEPSRLQVVPHQASPRAVEILRRLMGFTPGQYHDRVASLGNMAAASIPAVFHQCRAEGRLPAGQDVLLLGTSAGYSQAGLVFRM